MPSSGRQAPLQLSTSAVRGSSSHTQPARRIMGSRARRGICRGQRRRPAPRPTTGTRSSTAGREPAYGFDPPASRNRRINHIDPVGDAPHRASKQRARDARCPPGAVRLRGAAASSPRERPARIVRPHAAPLDPEELVALLTRSSAGAPVLIWPVPTPLPVGDRPRRPNGVTSPPSTIRPGEPNGLDRLRQSRSGSP
jgi:hypothetical protein